MSEIEFIEEKWFNAVKVNKLRTGKKKMLTLGKKLVLLINPKHFADTCVGL